MDLIIGTTSNLVLGWLLKKHLVFLKGRSRILLKWIEVSLQNLSDLVTTCICLHNLCIINGDEFNMRWAKKVKKDLKDSTNWDFGYLLHVAHDAITFKIAKDSMKQMEIILLPSSMAFALEFCIMMEKIWKLWLPLKRDSR